MKFAFVILHYKTYQDTKACIESILQIETRNEEKVEIIVVDNASNNGSVENLENEFGIYENVFFIKNKENSGFAKGNNIGYFFAKEQRFADFILVLNNDIVIPKQDFLHIIKKQYEKNSFYVMGPDIVSMVDAGHQNPVMPTSNDKKAILKETIRYAILLLLSKINLYDILQKLSKNKKNDIKNENKMYRDAQEGCQLHGAFLIFSPKYTKMEQNAFFSETFLYCEEALLYQYCLRKGYLTIYCPEIIVYHKEDSSTEHITKTAKAKREFVFKNLIKSHWIYYKFLRDHSEWK